MRVLILAIDSTSACVDSGNKSEKTYMAIVYISPSYLEKEKQTIDCVHCTVQLHSHLEPE